MGAGASSQQAQEIQQASPELAAQTQRIHELKLQVDEKDKVIASLEARLKARDEESARPSMLAVQSYKKDKGKVRRGEISAEAVEAQPQASEKYSKVSFSKDEQTRQLIKKAVGTNILFKGLREEEKDECVEAFFRVDLKDGEKAIQHGDVGDNFYVVQSGTLEVFLPMKDNLVNVGEVKEGMCFGELALMYNEPRAATVQAKTNCVLWTIARKTFRAIHIHHKVLRKKQYEQFLIKVPQLSTLRTSEITRLADAVEEEEFEEGSVIIREGTAGDHFYIIVSGEVSYSKVGEGTVGNGGPGDFFGHKALITEETRAATVTADTPVFCLSMHRNDFVTLLGSLQEIVNRKDVLKPGTSTKAMDEYAYKYHKNIQYSDIQRKFKRRNREREIILGQGAFGKVQIVKHKETGETFALKCLKKSQIVQSGLQAHVVCERQVMTMIDHPFLLKLYNSYWDTKYIYFLVELCLGGELFTLLRKQGRFPEKTSKFYSAFVVQAFEHLHSKHIVYRDLKPENLMLDSQGYIKVVDFGLAKVVNTRTWTICGTPDYLAPEIIQSVGHDKGVDYWALGILIYELTAGEVPFQGEDTMQLYSAIVKNEVSYPTLFSRNCTNLVSSLLQTNQTKRLGNTKEGVQGIIKHRWFSGFDWDGLVNRTLTPPIVPNVEHPEDTSNFEDYDFPEDVNVAVCNWQPDFPYEVVDGKTVGM